MRIEPKLNNLNRSKSQIQSANLTRFNNNLKSRELVDSLLTDSLKSKERDNTMSVKIKASDYSKALTNHLKSIENTLTGAGIKDKTVLDSSLKQAENQFRTDFLATGGKHEDFFSSKVMNQLQVVQREIDKLNGLNPTGKGGVSVQVGTITKKI